MKKKPAYKAGFLLKPKLHSFNATPVIIVAGSFNAAPVIVVRTFNATPIVIIFDNNSRC